MKHRSQSRRITACTLLVAQLATSVPVFAAIAAPAAAPAAGAADRSANATLLRHARSLYAQARYDEAVTALYGPVNRGELKGADLRDARLVMARCYVKKGLTLRATNLFAAIVANDPSFVLDSSRADAEEIAVFNAVKPPAATESAAPAPAAPHAAPHPIALGPAPDHGGGWLSRHKLLAGALAVGAGSAVIAFAGSGSSDNHRVAGASLPGFPPPPNR